jgi:hypothetical protein
VGDAEPARTRTKLEVAHHHASEQDLEAFCDLSELEYPGEPVTDPTFVAWKHLKGPDGPSTAVELKSGADVQGRLWSQRRRWLIHGREHTASNPVDLVIRPEARALPSLLRLLNGAFAVGAKETDLVFHTSSPSTDLMYRRFMHMVPVADLDGAVIPLRPAHLLAARRNASADLLVRGLDAVWGALLRGVGRMLGRSVALVENVTPEDGDRIVTAFHEEEQVASVRDASWRDWRFRDPAAPGYRFRWILWRGRPLGWLAIADRDVDGMRLRFVLDVVAPGAATTRLGRALWWTVAAGAYADGRDAVVLLANLKGNERLSQLTRLPFVRVARTRLPQEVPLFVRWSDASHEDLLDLAGGYWTMADFDMI